jgi:2-polyprenyl-3-methyl-5-hydroxy-6-metoxy-1,4-benzoquinol methylase
MDNLKTTYDAIAKDWSATYAADTWWQPGTLEFALLLPPQATVLDIGCGAGDKTAFLVQAGLRAQGVDFSESMIQLARERFPGLSFQVEDINALKAQTPFDGVYLQAVLLHFPKKQVPGVLARMAALLRPGGLIYATVKEIQAGQPDEVTKDEVIGGKKYQRFFSNYSPDELEKYFIKHFGVVKRTSIPGRSSNWLQVIAEKAKQDS